MVSQQNERPDPGSDWLARLQEGGYRLTAPRRAVVETIASSPHVLDPQKIFEVARQRYPKLGLVTVYRTIEKLEQLGLVQRVHQPENCQSFFAAAQGHEHPLICRQCGRVEYFTGDSDLVERLSASVSRQSGYQIKDHWLQFFGTCALCQQARGN